jgi:basic amino acid/polyamine antiporter, APA family
VGLAVLASGLTSMATASRVFSGYFTGLFPALEFNAVMVFFILFLAGVIFWGIRETIMMNTVLTIIETLGLAVVIIVGLRYLGSVNYLDAVSSVNPTGEIGLSIILTGGVLTFYSFVGFEDMLNVSEEIKKPETTLPKGLVLAVVISSAIYMIISLIAVSVVPAAELANSKQPLVDVVAKAAPWFPTSVYSIIAMFAVANTALLNFVMGSRLLYGMSKQAVLPKGLGHLHPKRATPHRSIIAILIILLILVFSGDISSLAKATSILLLACFTVVNIALIILKRKDKSKGRFEIPTWIPAAGAFVCLAMLSQAQASELKIAGSILVVIAILYLIVRPDSKLIEKLES